MPAIVDRPTEVYAVEVVWFKQWRLHDSYSSRATVMTTPPATHVGTRRLEDCQRRRLAIS